MNSDFLKIPDSFFAAVLGSISHQIAVIDKSGLISYVNGAWSAFCTENGNTATELPGSNYLDLCDTAQQRGDQFARTVASGIRRVICGNVPTFDYEHPFQSRNGKLWLMVQALRLKGYSPELFLICRQNITQHRLAEQQIELLEEPAVNVSAQRFNKELFNTDWRRHFKDSFNIEWLRNKRDHTPISLMIFGIDHFNRLNAEFGPRFGNTCLTRMSLLIQEVSRRPTDLAVRWGDDEFILLLGNTDVATASQIAERIRVSVQNIPATECRQFTISAGVASLIPGYLSFQALVYLADNALHRAIQSGRNRISVADAADWNAT